MKPRAWLVSELTMPSALEANRNNRESPYRSRAFDDLVAAVGGALRDVKFHRHGNASAIVYRDGDTHALGEIGYKNTKSKGNGEPTYYVQSRRIENHKYKEGSWQHHIVATKVLKTAVTAASTYLVPFTCAEAVDATREVARQIINEQVNKFNALARSAFKGFTGEAGYSSNMDGELMRELRTHTFISPKLNEAAAAYYAAYDAWQDAIGATKGGVYYVGVTDNYGQQVADTARVDMNYGSQTECFDRMPAESVADWVKGRVAVLSMTPPLHYVQGVGLRLDDRIFYVVGEKEEE
jgi:hypothetical protein